MPTKNREKSMAAKSGSGNFYCIVGLTARFDVGWTSLAATSRVGAVSADDRAGAVATVGVLLSGDKVVMRASDDRTRSGGLAVGGLIALVRLARARLRFVCGELRAGRG
jgi:hypothetical protein